MRCRAAPWSPPLAARCGSPAPSCGRGWPGRIDRRSGAGPGDPGGPTLGARRGGTWMFIPLGDDNTGRRITPVVVYLLILANALVWFLQLTMGDLFTMGFSTIPYE